MWMIKFGCDMFLSLAIVIVTKAELRKSAWFLDNPKPVSETPYRTIPILHGNDSPVHGALECMNDEMCLSYDMGDGEAMQLYTGFVCRGGTHCLKTRCPSKEFMRYSRALDMCYRLSEYKINWDTANETCYQQGGRLIVLDTDRKFTQFRTEYNKANRQSFWLGARRTNSRWHWINGQEIFLTNPNWHGRNPDRGGNPCINSGRYYFGSIGMDDQYCSIARHFVCEF